MVSIMIALAAVNAGFTVDEAEIIGRQLTRRFGNRDINAISLTDAYAAVTEIFADIDNARRDNTM